MVPCDIRRGTLPRFGRDGNEANATDEATGCRQGCRLSRTRSQDCRCCGQRQGGGKGGDGSRGCCWGVDPAAADAEGAFRYRALEDEQRVEIEREANILKAKAKLEERRKQEAAPVEVS